MAEPGTGFRPLALRAMLQIHAGSTTRFKPHARATFRAWAAGSKVKVVAPPRGPASTNPERGRSTRSHTFEPPVAPPKRRAMPGRYVTIRNKNNVIDAVDATHAYM